jgi:serine/threonine protein kinase
VRCSHVVQVFDHGREGSVPFLVTELLEGETLEQRLRRGVLTPRELDKIFGEVASGLRRVHATGIVHRDLKPSNIFIAREGSADVTKLIDFGIVKVDEARLGFTPRASTRAGTVIGTPEYMSPEQLRAGAEIDRCWLSSWGRRTRPCGRDCSESPCWEWPSRSRSAPRRAIQRRSSGNCSRVPWQQRWHRRARSVPRRRRPQHRHQRRAQRMSSCQR